MAAKQIVYNENTRHGDLRRPGPGWRHRSDQSRPQRSFDASSIASLMLTTEALVAETPEKDKAPAPDMSKY